jgi:iron complex transport system permease protein
VTTDQKPAPPHVTWTGLTFWFAGLLAAAGLFWFLASLVPYEGSLAFWRWQTWEPRAWRLAAAATVGLALGAAGLALQGLLRNPLAEPYILGISSGAGVGVLIGEWLAGAAVVALWITTPTVAMAGALLTAAVVYTAAQRRGRLDPYVLILTGVIVNVFNGAIIMMILKYVKQEEIVSFIGWAMGQIPETWWYKPVLPILCAALVLVGWVWLFVRGSALNALGLGDEVASSIGVSVHALRTEVFVVASIMTAAAVAVAGPVGFVGLIVPHVLRLVLGPDHRLLVIASGLSGAIFLMAADTFCRLLELAVGGGELPVGVITAMTGGPFFILLLRRGLREGRA